MPKAEKTNMKKIIFLMLLAIIGWQQGVAQSFTFGGIKYTVTSPTTVEVANQLQATTGNFIIPAQVNYNNGTYAVTRIGNQAFYTCTTLTSVIIPNSVTSIGDQAFAYCYLLTSVTIPNSVTSIGDRAFQQCSGLTSVTIPNSVTSIGDGAFQQCSGLASVTISNSVTGIGSYAFASCSGLTSVTIPNSLSSIGFGAFRDCTGLTSVIISNSVTSIGDGAFQNCFGLTSVTVNWSTPLAINNSVFEGINTSTVVLNVPIGKASIYDTTVVWTDFIINEALSLTPFSATIGFDLIVYPNPSNNVFNFKINGGNDETVSLLVFDMTGRQIENKVVRANDVKNISLGQNYSGGVYNVIVAQGRKTKSVRLVKE